MIICLKFLTPRNSLGRIGFYLCHDYLVTQAKSVTSLGPGVSFSPLWGWLHESTFDSSLDHSLYYESVKKSGGSQTLQHIGPFDEYHQEWTNRNFADQQNSVYWLVEGDQTAEEQWGISSNWERQDYDRIWGEVECKRTVGTGSKQSKQCVMGSRWSLDWKVDPSPVALENYRVSWKKKKAWNVMPENPYQNCCIWGRNWNCFSVSKWLTWCRSSRHEWKVSVLLIGLQTAEVWQPESLVTEVHSDFCSGCRSEKQGWGCHCKASNSHSKRGVTMILQGCTGDRGRKIASHLPCSWLDQCLLWHGQGTGLTFPLSIWTGV